MENLRFSIAAGETKVFVKAGRYFEILEASGSVTLAFYDESGNQHNDARDVLSGTYLEDRFSGFDISSSTAQTVEIFVSDGKAGTKRQPGNVRVIDEITDALTTAFFAPSTAVAAYAATPLVLPASNTRGLIVRWAYANAQAGAAGTAYCGVVAAKSAPTGYQVPAQRYPVMDASSNNSAVNTELKDFKLNKMLPAGWGLYGVVAVSGSVAGAVGAGVGYELL